MKNKAINNLKEILKYTALCLPAAAGITGMAFGFKGIHDSSKIQDELDKNYYQSQQVIDHRIDSLSQLNEKLQSGLIDKDTFNNRLKYIESDEFAKDYCDEIYLKDEHYHALLKQDETAVSMSVLLIPSLISLIGIAFPICYYEYKKNKNNDNENEVRYMNESNNYLVRQNDDNKLADEKFEEIIDKSECIDED